MHSVVEGGAASHQRECVAIGTIVGRLVAEGQLISAN